MLEGIGAACIVIGLFVILYAICARFFRLAQEYASDVQGWMVHCTVGQRGYIINEVMDVGRKDYIWIRFWGRRVPAYGPLVQFFQVAGSFPDLEKDKDWWGAYTEVYCRLDRKQRRKVNHSMSHYGAGIYGFIYSLRKHDHGDKLDAWQRRVNPPVTAQMAEEYEEIMRAQELMYDAG